MSRISQREKNLLLRRYGNRINGATALGEGDQEALEDLEVLGGMGVGKPKYVIYNQPPTNLYRTG